MLKMFILSVLLLLVGLLMLIKPNWIFELESWKYEANTEPSKTYLFSIRFGGTMCSIVGLVGIIYYLFLS